MKNLKPNVRSPVEARSPNCQPGVRPARSVLECGSPLPLSPRVAGPPVPQSARGLAHSKTSRPDGAQGPSCSLSAGASPHRSRGVGPTHVAGYRALATSLMLLSALLPPLSTTQAQPFSLDWYSIAGGGGTSTGGGFSVQGTIGQPDTGVLADGGFTVTGGFPGFHVVPAGPVTLTIQLLARGQVQVSWPADGSGWVLEAATSLWPASVWQTVASPPATSYSTPAMGPAGYFRLRRP